MAAAIRAAWLKPRRRCAERVQRDRDEARRRAARRAVATDDQAAISSATPSAPRNLSALTRSRPGPRRRRAPRPRHRGARPARAAGSAAPRGRRGRADARAGGRAAGPAQRRSEQARITPAALAARAALRVGTALRQSRACRVTKPRAIRISTGSPTRWCSCRWRCSPGSTSGASRSAPRGAAAAGRRGAGPLQALAFAGGMLALLAALVSPLDGLGEDYLFSAHMVQHVLLGDIAPLLILLGLSRVIMRPATRRLTRRGARARPARQPRDRHRRLAGADVPLAHPRALRRGGRARRSCTCSSTPPSSPPGSRSGGR